MEAAGVVEAALVARLAKALGISSEDINTDKPLHAYGGKYIPSLKCGQRLTFSQLIL